MPVDADPRLTALRARLLSPQLLEQVSVDPTRLDETPDPALDRMEAAVALVIRARPQLDFLLIKRAEHERDPWSGQMALPGGRWERDDPGLLHTAIRETLEETGVDLAGAGVPIGRLSDVEPASPRLPRMRIAPYVFAVPEATEARVASRELADVHWIPIDVLADATTASTTRIHFSGFSKTFPSYHVAGEHVWGLTHRILTAFLERYRTG